MYKGCIYLAFTGCRRRPSLSISGVQTNWKRKGEKNDLDITVLDINKCMSTMGVATSGTPQRRPHKLVKPSICSLIVAVVRVFAMALKIPTCYWKDNCMRYQMVAREIL